MRAISGSYEDYIAYVTSRRLCGEVHHSYFVITDPPLFARRTAPRRAVVGEIRAFRQRLAQHEPRSRAVADEVAEFRRELRRLGGPA